MFDWLKTSPRLKRRIEELEDEVRELRKDAKAIESEWNSYYESMKRLEGKLSKRAKRTSDDDCGCGGTTPPADTPEARDALLARARGRHGHIPGMR